MFLDSIILVKEDVSEAERLFNNSADFYKVSSTEGSEKAMALHSSTLAWKIPWTEEPGGLQSMGSLRVRHD